MGISRAKTKWLKYLSMLCLAAVLFGCVGEDKPFTLVGDVNEPVPVNPGTSTPPGGTVDGCVVNLLSEMQLKISVKKADGSTLEKLDAIPKPMDPIPIIVNGNNLVLEGETFPEKLLNTLGDPPPADILVHGISGKNATGTFDPATGSININGFSFGLEFFLHDQNTHILPGVYELSGVDFKTEQVTATGNLNPITVEGKPYNVGDGTIVLATAITLPTDFGAAFAALNGSIGGGALTATLTGTLDQDPSKCTAGGETPGGGTPGGGSSTSPAELSVSDGSKDKLTEIDFGSTLAVITQKNGKTILDCSEASNRGSLTKTITIKNTGEGDRKIKLLRTQDADGDTKDPLCSGTSEFVRGSITTKGSATCTKVTVGGKDFVTDECTIPKGDGNSISFPLLYAPFNYVKSGGGAPEPAATPEATPTASAATSVPDSGILKIQFDDKTFDVKLKGLTEPDVRDSLAIARVKEGVVSKKLIRNGKGIKIAPKESEALPFSQEFALLNSGSDSYENATFTLATGTNFSVEGIEGTNVSSGTSDNPGKVKFKIKFSPSGSDKAFSDKLSIKLKKVGSTGEVTLTYSIQGIVGDKPISGDYLLQVDYLTALIDTSLLTGKPPVESLDFRDFQEQAPKPQPLSFQDLTADDIQPVGLVPLEFDPLVASKTDRIQALRILNAQGSIGLDGQKMKAGDDSTLCREPDPINVPFTDGCAYFYFNLKPDPEKSGIYDPESGDLTLPNLTLRIRNPYHADVGGVWPATNPNNSYPDDKRLDTEMKVTLTTLTLDSLSVDGVSLVPDTRLNIADLNLIKKESWKGVECSSDDSITSPEKPHFRCFLTSDGKYLQGHALTVREGKDGVYDVIFVGVGKFNPAVEEPDVPIFMDGNRIYIAIQGRLCKDEAACAL